MFSYKFEEKDPQKSPKIQDELERFLIDLRSVARGHGQWIGEAISPDYTLHGYLAIRLAPYDGGRNICPIEAAYWAKSGRRLLWDEAAQGLQIPKDARYFIMTAADGAGQGVYFIMRDGRTLREHLEEVCFGKRQSKISHLRQFLRRIRRAIWPTTGLSS